MDNSWSGKLTGKTEATAMTWAVANSVVLRLSSVFLAPANSPRLFWGGSYARMLPKCGDLDLVIEQTEETDDLVFEAMKMFAPYQILVDGPKQKRIMLTHPLGKQMFQWDIWYVPESEMRSWGCYVAFVTGNAKFNVHMRVVAKKHGMTLGFNLKPSSGDIIETPDEITLFYVLKMKYRTPKERSL